MATQIRAALRRLAGRASVESTTPLSDHEVAAIAETKSDWTVAAEFYRSAMIKDFQNPEHQLRLAMMLDRLKRGNEAKAHALVAIDTTLKARYDARAAHQVHPTFFAARHEMAEFILDNHELLKTRIRRRIAGALHPVPKPVKVFVFWDAPERTPEIVHRCRASLHRFVDDGYELVELSNSNLSDYVSIDSSIRERMSGKPAHFSDYLRSRLLQEHGGLWLDSTCLLTRPLSEALAVPLDSEAFLFTYAGSRVGSWFFWARADSYILNAIAETEILWWERNEHLTNYFMWHDIVEMLYWTDNEYRSAWDGLPRVHPRPALALLSELEKPYDRIRYAEILAASGIHKLTHKLPAEAFESDTFARRILDNRAGK